MWETVKLRLKGWKTVLAAALYSAAGVALELHDSVSEALNSSGVDWKSAVDPKYVPWLLIGTGVVFGLLRIVTRGPLGHKGDAEPAPVKAGD
jgi:hypothetical protein